MGDIFRAGNGEWTEKIYEGQRVITLSDIDHCTSEKSRYYCMKFYLQKEKLIEGTDYFHIPAEEYRKICEVKTCNGAGGFMLTSKGFQKLYEMKSNRSKLDRDIKKGVMRYFKEVERDSNLNHSTDGEQELLSSVLSKYIEVQMNVLKMNQEIMLRQEKANEELRAICSELINRIPDVKEDYGLTRSKKEIAIGDYCETPIIIKESDDYQTWKKNINKAVGMIVGLKGKYKTDNEVLHEAYNALRDQYGVVWDQSKKDFRESEGRSPANTQELIYWLERNKTTYKNLLISKLNTIYSEELKTRRTA